MSPIDNDTDLARRGLLPAGLRDVLPLDAAHEATVIEALITTVSAEGYDRVKPPLVEFESSLFAGPGAAMRESTFRLMDPMSQRMMGVRADVTVQIARIAATRLKDAPRPLRLCYAGEVLRVMAGQLNPERQLEQVGAELVGPNSIEADVEAILLAVEALRSAGAEHLSVDITAPRLVPELLAVHELDGSAGAALRAAIDRKELAEVRALGGDAAATLNLLMDAAGARERGIEKLSGVILPDDARTALDRLIEVSGRIAEAEPGLNVTIDPVENRGFEYYTGIGFSLFSRGVRGELGRGGRYVVDGTGGEGSVGFTLYMETVLRALPDPCLGERLYLPYDTPRHIGSSHREQGWVTVAGLIGETDIDGEARRLGCSHVLDGPDLRALDNN